VSSIGGNLNGYNLFAYCFNNPIIHADGEGDFPWPIIPGIIILGGIVGRYFGYNSDTKMSQAGYHASNNTPPPSQPKVTSPKKEDIVITNSTPAYDNPLFPQYLQPKPIPPPHQLNHQKHLQTHPNPKN